MNEGERIEDKRLSRTGEYQRQRQLQIRGGGGISGSYETGITDGDIRTLLALHSESLWGELFLMNLIVLK